MTAAGQPSPASNGNSHDNGNEASSSKALHTRTPSFLDMSGGWVLLRPTAETAMRRPHRRTLWGLGALRGAHSGPVDAVSAAHRAQLNPTRMGVPKRCASLNQQVDGFVKEHGGDRPIYRSVPNGTVLVLVVGAH